MAITAPVRIRVVRQPKVRIRVIPRMTAKDGASAYEIAVENGFVGTEEEWLASLVGQPGQPGEPGTPGEPGSPGADGLIVEIQAGDNITVDATDPARPIVSSTASGDGTVTSVAMTVPTGLSVSGSPITTSGTFDITFASGYSIPTTTKQGQWDTAYGWGNHASAGYLTTAAAASAYQPLDSDLTSWAGVTRASGFDTFAATPSSANLRALLTDEVGTGAAVFESAIREKLTANRTYYVRADGSDSNNGLANTSGGAFLTIQKAVDVAYGTLDLGGFDCVIQVADGTYTGGANVISPQVGAGFIILSGNVGTTANCIISATNHCIDVRNSGSTLYVRGFKLQSSAGSGIFCNQAATVILVGNMEFGACNLWTMLASNNSVILRSSGDYVISGGSNAAANASYGAIIDLQGGTVTLTGTPAFAQGFARASAAGTVKWALTTFSGAATGQRYNVDSSATIFTNGGGANYFPGNAAGTNNSGAGHYA